MRPTVSAVVVGASAGGVEALNKLFKALNKPLPVPMLVVLHIAPRGSIIVGAFSGVAKGITVKEGEDKESLRPGSVYFAPPNYHLLVEKDFTVSLSVDEPVHFARPSIDVLFESAADAFGENLLGILLTGANEDGAEGLHKIHRAGGITVVQDPATAQAPTMPAAALKAFEPTAIASLDEIRQMLARLEPAGEGIAYA